MWPLLSDPQHAAYCVRMGSRLAPLGRVLAALASRPYADSVYCYTSHDRIFITTAPSYKEYQDHPEAYRDIICICPVGQRFRVGYGATPESQWGWRKVDDKLKEFGCWEFCNEAEAVALVDRIVPRDLMALAAKEGDE
jgi:hypothetical protein